MLSHWCAFLFMTGLKRSVRKFFLDKFKQFNYNLNKQLMVQKKLMILYDI